MLDDKGAGSELGEWGNPTNRYRAHIGGLGGLRPL